MLDIRQGDLMLYFNFDAGIKMFSYSFIAWYKLISNTQEDFSVIGMTSRDLFFFMLTGG
jgi:hypothetical protein